MCAGRWCWINNQARGRFLIRQLLSSCPAWEATFLGRGALIRATSTSTVHLGWAARNNFGAIGAVSIDLRSLVNMSYWRALVRALAREGDLMTSSQAWNVTLRPSQKPSWQSYLTSGASPKYTGFVYTASACPSKDLCTRGFWGDLSSPSFPGGLCQCKSYATMYGNQQSPHVLY